MMEGYEFTHFLNYRIWKSNILIRVSKRLILELLEVSYLYNLEIAYKTKLSYHLNKWKIILPLNQKMIIIFTTKRFISSELHKSICFYFKVIIPSLSLNLGSYFFHFRDYWFANLTPFECFLNFDFHLSNSMLDIY